MRRYWAKERRSPRHKDAGVSTYTFGDTTTVGLRGHVVEIDFEPGYGNWRSEEYTPRSLIDAKTIKVPTEKKIVTLLQKLAKKADRVTIATDFDTEGELIGKEAFELIRAVNAKVPVDRARFSAITKGELEHAFSNTTELDFALAAAGEARQSIDLMWGASLTRFISLAARRGGQNILSVGRVQSPTLAMIVDREKEIEAFVPEKYWQLGLDTEKSGEQIEARHTHGRFHDKAEAEGCPRPDKGTPRRHRCQGGHQAGPGAVAVRHHDLHRRGCTARVLGSKRDADCRRPVHERFHLLPEDRQHRLPGLAGHQRDLKDPADFPV